MLWGFYLPFAERLDPAANAQVHALAQSLLAAPLPGVTDVVAGYVNLYVEFDTGQVDEARVRRWTNNLQDNTRSPEPAARNPKTIPIRYDGEDLELAAKHSGLSVKEVIRRHSGATYRVYAMGFTPGFAYMGSVDPSIRLPRRKEPRRRVAAHTLAMAGEQTGIYPLPSPGGWNLLGTALEAVYDPHRSPPFLLEAGDTVRFAPSEGSAPPEPSALELLPPEPEHPALRVEEPGLLDLPVDGGRLWAGRYGLARSGPLDGHSARAANALVGNPADAPVLELSVRGPVLTALRTVVLAFAGFGMRPAVDGELLEAWQSFVVHEGQTLRFQPMAGGTRGYLAVAGGFALETFMGSASADLRGLIGRPLAAGDLLEIRIYREARAGFSLRPWPPDPRWPIRLIPGPQRNPEALRALLEGSFTVGPSDRMGMQLEGLALPGGEVLSEATPLGAVQVPPGGSPIILLNDRGTLGGYAKPARVHPADLPRVAQLRTGERVQFRLVRR